MEFSVFIHVYYYTGIIVEFKESIYSVIEDERIYNVTVTKQGVSMQEIVVNIFPSPETAKCEL